MARKTLIFPTGIEEHHHLCEAGDYQNKLPSGCLLTLSITPRCLFDFLVIRYLRINKNDSRNFVIFKSLGVKREKWRKLEVHKTWGSRRTRQRSSPSHPKDTHRVAGLWAMDSRLSGMRPPAMRRQKLHSEGKMLSHQSVSTNNNLIFST